MSGRWKYSIVLAVSLALVASSCTDDGSSESTTPEPPGTAEPPSTDTVDDDPPTTDAPTGGWIGDEPDWNASGAVFEGACNCDFKLARQEAEFGMQR